MTDQVVSPDNTQPGPSTAPPAPAVPPEPTPVTTDWEAKYKGMVNVLATKDKKLSELEGEVGTLAGTVKKLRDDAIAIQAAADATKLNLEQQIATAADQMAAKDQELSTAAVYRVKMDALKEFPDLIGLADTIPNLTDPDTMKSHLETLSKHLDSLAEEKATRKAAGFTPGPTTPVQGAYPYNSYKAWGEALKAAAGTDEFAKLDNAFAQWTIGQGESVPLPAQKVHQL